MVGGPARCLLLAGPSSAGKTSLARALQRVDARPWFLFEADRLSGGFPPDRPEFVTLEWDHKLREGCARAARGLVEAGLDVVVELGLWEPWGRATAARVLAGARTYVVRVRCQLDTLDDRERARGDRIPGTARAQLAELEGLPADFEVDTDRGSAETLADDLVTWLATEPTAAALAAMADEALSR